MKEFIKFSLEYELLSPKQSGETLSVRTDCLDLTIVNLGATTAFVNGMPLLAGTSHPVGANFTEWNEAVINVKCDQPTGTGLGVWVIRKLFTGVKKVE